MVTHKCIYDLRFTIDDCLIPRAGAIHEIFTPSILCVFALDKVSETFAQLYNVRVGFSGGAAPSTPLFAATVKKKPLRLSLFASLR